MLTTTLRLLREHSACADRYAYLVDALGARWGDAAPIPLVRILETNGLDDALWALRAVPAKQIQERDKQARLYACKCVREIWCLLSDERSRTAVEVAERYAHGQATASELAAAGDAAWDAACAAARDAARAAACAADRAADRAAAWAAAWAAAGDAAWAAARDAAWNAAWAAAGAKQAELFREMF